MAVGDSLPGAVTTLTVPAKFSASNLGQADCRRRVVATERVNRGQPDQLRAGPEAALGTLVHKALELRNVGNLPDPLSWLQSELDTPTRAGVAYTSLRDAIPPEKVTAVERLLAQRAPLRRPSRSVGLSSGREGSRVLGAEVSLASDQLRLSGQADFIERLDDGTIEIIDYKTGPVHDNDGNIRSAYALQLQAYGLMIRERLGPVKLRLILDNGRRETVASDVGAMGSAAAQIHEFVDSFPTADQVEGDPLASPGPACRYCPVRHACRPYLDRAPTWWPELPPSMMAAPADTWGEVLEVSQAENRTKVKLLDAAGRGVSVVNLDERHKARDLAVGQSCWFFALESRSFRRGFRGERLHPRNFHELVDPVGSERRAWSVELFT